MTLCQKIRGIKIYGYKRWSSSDFWNWRTIIRIERSCTECTDVYSIL